MVTNYAKNICKSAGPRWKAFVINNGLTRASSSKLFFAKQRDENRLLGTSGDKCEKVCHKGGCFLRRSLRRNILQRWSNGQFWTLDKHVDATFALSRKLMPTFVLNTSMDVQCWRLRFGNSILKILADKFVFSILDCIIICISYNFRSARAILYFSIYILIINHNGIKYILVFINYPQLFN